jgi:hypothetical protein
MTGSIWGETEERRGSGSTGMQQKCLRKNTRLAQTQNFINFTIQ